MGESRGVFCIWNGCFICVRELGILGLGEDRVCIGVVGGFGFGGEGLVEEVGFVLGNRGFGFGGVGVFREFF